MSTTIAWPRMATASTGRSPPTSRPRVARRTAASNSSLRGRPMRIITILFVLVTPVTAFAQAFPGDGAYAPFHCSASPMVDGFADDANALDERDLVGDDNHPAGLRA